MGGCYSATKGTKKESGLVPEPQVVNEETTTLEVTKMSNFETLLKEEDVTCDVSSSPKEETASEVVASSKEETTPEEVTLLPNEETTTSEVVSLPKKEDVTKEDVITNEVVVPEDDNVSKVTMTNVKAEAPMKNDENCDVKETKEEKDEEEIKDESKVTIEKKTLEEETGPKGEEAPAVATEESGKDCEVVEVQAVEEQKTDKQSPAV